MEHASLGEFSLEEFDFLGLVAFPVFKYDESWSWSAEASQVLVALVVEGRWRLFVDKQVLEVEGRVFEDDLPSELGDFPEQLVPVSLCVVRRFLGFLLEGFQLPCEFRQCSFFLHEFQCFPCEVKRFVCLVDNLRGESCFVVEREELLEVGWVIVDIFELIEVDCLRLSQSIGVFCDKISDG